MIDETNKKLKSYRIPTRTGFIVNANINGSGLTRSKLHFNREGSSIFAENMSVGMLSL